MADKMFVKFVKKKKKGLIVKIFFKGVDVDVGNVSSKSIFKDDIEYINIVNDVGELIFVSEYYGDEKLYEEIDKNVVDIDEDVDIFVPYLHQSFDNL